MFGLFGCGKKVEETKKELQKECEKKITKLKAEYETKISELENELSKRKRCSTNTLDKLEEMDKAINNLKNEIIKNNPDHKLNDDLPQIQSSEEKADEK